MKRGQWTGRQKRNEGIDRALTMFPVLKERLRQRAGTLSGGEKLPIVIGPEIIRLVLDGFAELSNGEVIISPATRFLTSLKGSLDLVVRAPLARQQQQEENPQP